MNTESEIANDQIPGPSPESAPALDHRGNGKVARLPKNLRDQINHWFLDSLSYLEIIERLGEHGKDLKPDNLSQWKKRDHQLAKHFILCRINWPGSKLSRRFMSSASRLWRWQRRRIDIGAKKLIEVSPNMGEKWCGDP